MIRMPAELICRISRWFFRSLFPITPSLHFMFPPAHTTPMWGEDSRDRWVRRGDLSGGHSNPSGAYRARRNTGPRNARSDSAECAHAAGARRRSECADGSMPRWRKRILEVASKYGIRKSQELIEELLDYSERLVRAELRTMPAGDFSAEDWLDDDGVTDIPRKICVRITFDPVGSRSPRRFFRLLCPGCRQLERCARHYSFSLLLRASLPAA
jgi:hypothetical protein